MLAEVTISKTESGTVPGKNYHTVKLTHENGNTVLLTVTEQEYNILVNAGHIPEET